MKIEDHNKLCYLYFKKNERSSSLTHNLGTSRYFSDNIYF